jgi:ABC-type antimicrobial peptide transport system permease subunit
VTTTDPTTLALSCGLLLVVIIAAALIPARRASRIDPMLALRSD